MHIFHDQYLGVLLRFRLEFIPRNQDNNWYIHLTQKAPTQLENSALYSLQPIPLHEILNHLTHLIRRLKTMPMTNMRQHLHALIGTQHQTKDMVTPFHRSRFVFLARDQQEGDLNRGVFDLGRVGDSLAERGVALGVLAKEEFADEGFGECGSDGSGGLVGD